jgi:hypothetical protein
MTGSIGILNVGAGDTKLIFDKDNPAELIRAARIVKDMLRRGYALLIEVEKDGAKRYERVRDFREDTCEYIIADFDPTVAEPEKAQTVEQPQTHEQAAPPAAEAGEEGAEKPSTKKPGRGRPRTRAIHASTTTGVAVARSAGG